MTSITGRMVSEGLAVGDNLYGRQCDDTGRNCGEWRERAREIILPVPSPSYLPQWPIVALEMAHGLQVVGEEDLTGETVIHLQARVNIMRSILENQRRIFDTAGISAFGQECTAQTGGQKECRETGFDELLDQHEPRLSYSDTNPSTVDVWIGTQDSFIRRIVFTAPPVDTTATLTFDYSDFNSVEIEAP